MAFTVDQAALAAVLADMQSIKQTMDRILADVQRTISSVDHLQGLADAYQSKLEAGEIPVSKQSLVEALLADADIQQYLSDCQTMETALTAFRDAHQGE